MRTVESHNTLTVNNMSLSSAEGILYGLLYWTKCICLVVIAVG